MNCSPSSLIQKSTAPTKKPNAASDTALDRRPGRRNKTVRGARRGTVLVSMLDSIKLHLPEFHLAAVPEEVSSSLPDCESRFTKMLRKNNGLDPPKKTRLYTLIPDP